MAPPKEILGRYRADVDGSSCEISEPTGPWALAMLAWIAVWDYSVLAALAGWNFSWAGWPDPPLRWLVWSPFPIIALAGTAWVVDQLLVRRSWLVSRGHIERRTRFRFLRGTEWRRSFAVRRLQLLREMWRSGRGSTDKLRFFPDRDLEPIELFRQDSGDRAAGSAELRALAALVERWTGCELHVVSVQVRDPPSD